MKALLCAFLCALSFSSGAQHHQPYAEQHDRDIKSLSEQEVQQYLQGAGMGFAKPAELNHFPGPMHVLELAEQMHLSEPQRETVRQLMAEHKATARELGARVVESERTLESLFREPKIEQARLEYAVNEAARLLGEYRLSHLETHRRMKALLTPAQVALYDELRGYPAGTKR